MAVEFGGEGTGAQDFEKPSGKAQERLHQVSRNQAIAQNINIFSKSGLWSQAREIR